MRAGETKGSRQVYGYIDEGQVPSAAELKRTGTNPSGAECPFGEKQVLFSSSSPLTATSIYTAFALTLQDESSSSRSSSIRRGGEGRGASPSFIRGQGDVAGGTIADIRYRDSFAILTGFVELIDPFCAKRNVDFSTTFEFRKRGNVWTRGCWTSYGSLWGIGRLLNFSNAGGGKLYLMYVLSLLTIVIIIFIGCFAIQVISFVNLY